MTIKKSTIRTVGIVVITVVALFSLQIFLKNGRKTCEGNCEASNGSVAGSTSSVEVDKIQVVHFHATQQCYSCITVGKYAKETLTERFADEYESGVVEFLDVNVELPENAEIVERFGAAGSSLYINVVRKGEDSISEDVMVWRLISDKEEYLDYFESKLRDYLK